MTLPLRIQNELSEYIEKHKIPKERQESLRSLVENIYKNSVYDPEEAVGVVTAQSLSEPATQMSIAMDEKIILKKDGITAIAPIGEFVDKAIDKMGYSENGWDICKLSSHGIYVPSITDKEKIEWKKVLECSRHRAPKHLIKIFTLSGRKITATDSHSFVVRKNNKIVPISGAELTVGERLPVVRVLRDSCTQSLKLKSVVDIKNVKKKMPDILVLDELLGWFIGAYVAKGNSTKYYVSLSNVNPEFLSLARQFAEKYGFSYNEYDNTRGFARGHYIRINSTLLSKFLVKTCSTGSKNKKIPQFAYGANEKFVYGVLRGYFDCDGNVSVGREMIRASSNSEELINGIMLLLSRFGIFATKQKEKQFSIIIPYKYAKAFKEKIGFSVHEKQQKLEKICNLESPKQEVVDMISGYGSLFMDIAKKLGYPTRHINDFTKRGRIGRETVSRYITIFERKAREGGVDIKKEISILKQMSSSDVVWDEITRIERVKPASEYVYDLTVEGTETFATFEGIITHNTMRTYHFAGTVGIQVTLGLPRILEIFDAKKEPETPTMTVRIVSDCQSPQKVKEIAERIKEVKVKDIVTSFIVDLTELKIRIKLNVQKLNELKIDKEKLPKLIKLRNASVSVKGDELIVAPKKKDMSSLYSLKYSVLESHILGIKGITQAIVTKDGDEWVINTLGSNLKKVFEIPGVDGSRTTSNNIFEVRDVLGIEAARNSIINQIQYTMEEQGLGVDIRYIMLLADLMTSSGEIRAIGRYGISGQKASPLVRASFEETKKHLITAAIKGEKDPMKGTIENIMVNQVAPIGTGEFGLVGSIPEEKKAPEKKPKAKPKAKPKTRAKEKKRK